MKKIKSIILLFTILFIGCKSEEIELTQSDDEQRVSETVLADASDAIKGVVRVKLTREVGDNLTVSELHGKVRSGQSGMDDYLQQIEALSMKRVFPYAGKFEERTRREGLHLWYDITFDEEKSVTRAATNAKIIPGVEIVEEVLTPVVAPCEYHIVDPVVTRSNGNPFNDPGLSGQWHYNNNGLAPKFRAGADIALFKAWEQETGKSNVIVAVVDGGIETKHEDLVENLWINLDEENGEKGVDDDDNGYVDDIHGYNFASNRGLITATVHGTHVAGTIGARNNNGIGVCGIAGGDGTPGSGVRLMSCQIIEQLYLQMKYGSPESAIKYGADNGAVISQNSWGYSYKANVSTIPASLKAAIDYFIKYAGCDNDGNQLPNSPMKGGVVVFAAGNDDMDFIAQPASYPPVVSVSAMAPDFKKARYTNRGDWITVMAPGGDDTYPRGQVYSTIPSSRYAYAQGTSMACPHVSGIAALIVSKFGGQGFTNEDLKRRITTAFLPVDMDEMNPEYKGRLGRGYISAEAAFAQNENKAPEQVGAVSVKEDFQSLKLEWKAVADEDDGTATFYRLYYSDKELTSGNYTDVQPLEVRGNSYKAGDKIIYELEGLSLNTRYFMAIVAEDRWGLVSAPIFFNGQTKKNSPPQLTRTGPEKIRICGKQIVEVKISIEDPDEHEWSFTFNGQQTGVFLKKEADGILVTFRAFASLGEYMLTVCVTDVFGASATIEIPYEIYENHPPKLLKEFAKRFVPINKNGYTINLSEYFTDEDGHEITYTARSLNPSILTATINDKTLTLNSLAIGNTSIVITATDELEAELKKTFQFQIVKDDLIYAVYPIPATDVLNVQLCDEIQNATLTIRTSTGTQVHKQELSVSSIESRLTRLNVSKLSSGTYMLHVEANGKSFRQSFIKQ